MADKLSKIVYPVTKVNNKTGDVTIGKSDVGLGNVDNVKQYSSSNPPPYPVTSVNGQTGAVDLGKVTDLHITATAESGINIRSINFYQIGRIIFGYIYFDATSAIPNGSRIATLNSSLATPYGAYATAAVHSSADSSGMVYIPRGVSNQIKTWGSISVGYEYYAEFMYVLA